MKIKICGITNLEDAQAAIEAGADLLGFNFYRKSARYVQPEVARSIVAQVRSGVRVPQVIGVFVNSSALEIQSIMREVDLDQAQLHGDESIELVAQVQGFKALRPQSLEEAEKQAKTYALASEPAVLIDAYRQGEYGGTGQVGDWSLAAQIAQQYPILLAGGLTPENVAEAIRQVRPWGIDVASGVESAPGKKDVAKMRAFVARAVNGLSNGPTNGNELR
ncbi:MAG: phosphoribosylanthranilate isomerase [Thermoflexales bacterium]|nr:phosphoribosylanthranilate isomerase [Thermoflexales bacterium]